jgi:hypothetical protein
LFSSEGLLIIPRLIFLFPHERPCSIANRKRRHHNRICASAFTEYHHTVKCSYFCWELI